MLAINYYFHVLLTSKYKLFINILIILAIYSMLYDNKVIFCMNDNPDITNVPALAEAKTYHRPSHQVLALKKEIEHFAGTIADLVESNEKLKNEVEVLGEIIDMQKKMINFPFEERLEYKRQIRSLQNEINLLEKELEKYES